MSQRKLEFRPAGGSFEFCSRCDRQFTGGEEVLEIEFKGDSGPVFELLCGACALLVALEVESWWRQGVARARNAGGFSCEEAELASRRVGVGRREADPAPVATRGWPDERLGPWAPLVGAWRDLRDEFAAMFAAAWRRGR